MSETVEEVQPEPKKRGRKVSPLTKAIRAYEEAHRKAEAARARYTKVAEIAEKKAAAEEVEREAYEALQQALRDVDSPPEAVAA
ncbi:hypothetical protein [Streptomyces griseus]|uniref:hypothetical protein n=1 Tax=Streptomyces griseus TaxID=1911 RepID=UPI0033CACCDA